MAAPEATSLPWWLQVRAGPAPGDKAAGVGLHEGRCWRTGMEAERSESLYESLFLLPASFTWDFPTRPPSKPLCGWP